jgi:PAP2 superfamily
MRLLGSQMNVGRVLVFMFALASFASGLAKAAGKPAYGYDSNVPASWYFLLYDRVKVEKLSPAVAARIFGATGVALYQAVQAGMQHHVSLVGQLNELDSLPTARDDQRYYWPSAANAALAQVLLSLFAKRPDSIAAFSNLQKQLENALKNSSPGNSISDNIIQRSVALGQAVGGAVASWAASDGFSQYNDCSFTPPVGPGLWRPTPPAFVPNPLQPCWGQLRPIVLKSSTECSPPPPPAVSTDPQSELHTQALEDYDTVNNLTGDQQFIAEFWADNTGQTGTPPGHWVDIVRQISQRAPLNLGQSAEAFARVGIAVSDAFIGCWQTKYTYNFIRPVTYIDDNIDPLWLPFLVTPAFPEYTSGHSTQSAAAAVVLTDMLGDNYAFEDTTAVDHGTLPPPASSWFSSFNAAAQQAAISRLLAGIHFRAAIENGFAQGTCIGNTVLNRVQFERHDQ